MEFDRHLSSCRCACQISKRYSNSNYQSRDFETSRNLTIRRLIWYWGPGFKFLLFKVTINTHDKNKRSFNSILQHREYQILPFVEYPHVAFYRTFHINKLHENLHPYNVLPFNCFRYRIWAILLACQSRITIIMLMTTRSCQVGLIDTGLYQFIEGGKMATIMQMLFLNAFSWMNSMVFWTQITLILLVVTISPDWFCLVMVGIELMVIQFT